MNYYDLELNHNNQLALQNDKILVKLKPHQLTALYKAIEMENKGEINYKIKDVNLIMNTDNSNIATDDLYTNIKIGTNLGIIGDMVGYGKTLIALSLIASNPLSNIHINESCLRSYNNNRHYNYLNITVPNNLIRKDPNIINTTLVIVPRGPVYIQWMKMVKESTNLKVLAIENFSFIKANLPKFNGNNKREIFDFFENYDLVLIKNTTFKVLYNNYYQYLCIDDWKRVMIDEAHDIIHQIPQTLNYHYLWLISGTYTDILKRSNTNYTYGVKALMNEGSINLILVKNNVEFIKNSFSIPEPVENFYLCKLPADYLIAKKFLTNAVLEKINANDFAGAIRDLGGKNETEDNIIHLVSKELKRELFNLEMEKEFYNNQDIPIDDKQAKIKIINNKIENQINKIADLTERIKSLDKNCAICMDNLENPIMLECTHLYCGKCIFQWIKSNTNCPYCRTPISKFNNLVAIVNNNKKENTNNQEVEILTKEDTFIKIIKNKQDGKFIVFTKNDNGFEMIKKKLNDEEITYEFLKGNTSHMMNVLDKFKKGQLNIIFLNTQFAGSGIDINYATDVIIFHSMGIDKNQAIGRAQRVGRRSQLFIHNLCYEHEI
jgi:rubrerythrin